MYGAREFFFLFVIINLSYWLRYLHILSPNAVHLPSVASIRRTLIKTTFTEAHSVHTNSDLLTIYECVEKNLSMNLSCNIWMICLKFIWLFYDTSCILQLSEFVWTLRHSTNNVFNNVLLIDATDRRKISDYEFNQKRLFFAVSLYPLSFFANTPFNNDTEIVFLCPCICTINVTTRFQ